MFLSSYILIYPHIFLNEINPPRSIFLTMIFFSFTQIIYFMFLILSSPAIQQFFSKGDMLGDEFTKKMQSKKIRMRRPKDMNFRTITDSYITLLPNVVDNCRPNLIDCNSGNVYYVYAPNLIDCRSNIMDSSITFLHQNTLLLFCVWINT